MRKIQIAKQWGSILVVSVIMLAVLAGLSVAVLSNSVNEKTIASNEQDQALAQESAISAAGQVKQLLMNNWVVGTPLCSGSGSCNCTAPCVWSYGTAFQGADFTQASWWNGNYASSLTALNPNLAGNPQYIIISLGCDAVANMYRFRIITRSVGASTNAVAFSDSVFSMPTSTQNAASCSSSGSCGGGTVTVQGVVDGTVQQTYTMAPSSFASYFFNDSGGTQCPQGGSSSAGCQMNCAGQINVIAWTQENNCVSVSGPWGTEQSSITLTHNGAQHTLMCAIPIICGGNSCSGVYSGDCLSCTNMNCSPSTGCSPSTVSTTSVPAPSPMSNSTTTYYCPNPPGTPTPPTPSVCTGSISCGGTTCPGTPSSGCQSCTTCSGSTVSYCPGSPTPSSCTQSCTLKGADGLPWPTVNPPAGTPTCTMYCWTYDGNYSHQGSFTVAGSLDGQGYCVPSQYGGQDSASGGISVPGTGLSDFCSWYFDCCSPCSTCDPCGPRDANTCKYPSTNCSGCSATGNCCSGLTNSGGEWHCSGGGTYCWGGG